MAVATGQHPTDELASCKPDLLFGDLADVDRVVSLLTARVTPALLILWLHLLSAMVWVGGLVYQTHVLLPAARRGGDAPVADMLRRGRPVTWTAVALVVLTGFYNVTRLGPLERVMESGAALTLALKFMLVLGAVAIAGQRDFAQVPRLTPRTRRWRRSAPGSVGHRVDGPHRAAAGGRDRLPGAGDLAALTGGARRRRSRVRGR